MMIDQDTHVCRGSYSGGVSRTGLSLCGFFIPVDKFVASEGPLPSCWLCRQQLAARIELELAGG